MSITAIFRPGMRGYFVPFSAGIALVVGTWPMFLVPVAIFAIANWGHIPVEEAKMHRQHGAAYDAYAHDVRRWV